MQGTGHAVLRDEALFKDPPAKEECPICFLPMPVKLICCVSLSPTTISSVPIIANDRLAVLGTQKHIICVVERLFANDVLGTWDVSVLQIRWNRKNK